MYNVLCVVVDSLVAIKIPRLGKPLVTNIALVRFLTGVSAHVFSERGTIRERLCAHTTSIGSFSIVSAHVRSHRRRLRELTVADVTLEWFFTGVNAEMRRQIGGLREGF